MSKRQPKFREKDGICYPRLTTILGEAFPKPQLARFYGAHGTEKANQISNEAKNLGTKIHHAATDYLKDPAFNPELYNEDCRPAIIALDTWAKAVNLQVIKAEDDSDDTVLYSKEHGYCCKPDLIAQVNGLPSIVEWKTSKEIYPEYPLQAAAQCYATAETPATMTIWRAYIVKLPKAGALEFEVMELNPQKLSECFARFLDVLDIWKFLNTWEQFKKETKKEEIKNGI